MNILRKLNRILDSVECPFEIHGPEFKVKPFRTVSVFFQQHLAVQV